nr:helix-turn-helix transcriptional regulator [uncultured Blautia sp.]
MHENYEKQISLEDISRYIGISESHLRRSFRRETGMTVVDYITRYRIEKAKRLLETGQYVIGEIYEKVGFSTSQYFSIVFKRYEKISPGQYQKKWSSQRE